MKKKIILCILYNTIKVIVKLLFGFWVIGSLIFQFKCGRQFLFYFIAKTNNWMCQRDFEKKQVTVNN